MRNGPQNQDESGSALPARLRELRERAHLSKADLAARAGLTYRTIHDLEAGRRQRIQEKTLLLLAEALDVPLDELLGREPAAGLSPSAPAGDAGPGAAVRPDGQAAGPAVAALQPASRAAGWPILWGLAAVVVLLLVAGGAIWHHARAYAQFDVDDDVIVGRDSVLGLEIWRRQLGQRIRTCNVAPWCDRTLLVGLYDRSLEPGRFLAVDRGTGEVRWSIGADLDHLRESFGSDALDGGTLVYQRHVVCDLFGPGEPVMVVQFQHSLWYPVALVFVTCEGEVLGQYDSWGHIFELVVADLDGDGREEVVAAGTNNAKAFQGATIFVLDHERRSGATVDPQTRPETNHVDNSRVRIVLPAFPAAYQRRLQDKRLHAYQLRVLRDSQGDVRIAAQVGDSARRRFLTVTFDSELRPLGSDISDQLRSEILHAWPDSLKLNTGPVDPGWRAAWLDRHVRYVAGERQ